MHIERSIDIAAPPERVWAVFSDVERWHEWTASITSVKRLDQGPFGVGSRALVLQPQLRPATFEVIEFTAGRHFTSLPGSNGEIFGAKGWSVRADGAAVIPGVPIPPRR